MKHAPKKTTAKAHPTRKKALAPAPPPITDDAPATPSVEGHAPALPTVETLAHLAAVMANPAETPDATANRA